jgi:sulfur-oxidizing protein SoxX
MSATRALPMLFASAVLLGCAPRSEEFTLPAGDAERGREAFVAFRCYDCHDVHNVELPPRDKSDVKIFKLGGEVARDKKYGDLVTGVINPSHRLAAGYVPAAESEDGKSPMKVYNDVMTVAQLVDIVTFLQQHYELLPYEPTDYPTYYP